MIPEILGEGGGGKEPLLDQIGLKFMYSRFRIRNKEVRH